MLQILLSVIGIYIAVRIVGIVVEGTFMSFVDWFQKKVGVSNGVAGELFQAPGTSAPEIAINTYATYIALENPALGIATIIGSAIFQLTIVIAVPLFSTSKNSNLEAGEVIRSVSVYGVAVLLLLLASLDGVFTAWELGGMTLTYAAYIVYLLRTEDESVSYQEVHESSAPPTGVISALDYPVKRLAQKVDSFIPGPNSSISGFFIALAVIGVLCAGLVELAGLVGTGIGLGSTFVAITLLAAGSSVPELTSNVVKAREGKIDQVIGNAVGSNSFDIFVSFAAVSFIASWQSGGLVMPNPSSITIPVVFLMITLLAILGVLWLEKWKPTEKTAWTGVTVYVLFVLLTLYS